MSNSSRRVLDVPVLECAADGELLSGGEQALDLIGDAFGHEADWVLVPAARLSPDFLDLSTGVAGEVIQKFVNYRLGFAVIGDISARLNDSKPLRDFVYETNRGKHAWFVADFEEFEQKLAGR